MGCHHAAITAGYGNGHSRAHLHRVVVEVRHHDLILVVDRHKVWPWRSSTERGWGHRDPSVGLMCVAALVQAVPGPGERRAGRTQHPTRGAEPGDVARTQNWDLAPKPRAQNQVSELEPGSQPSDTAFRIKTQNENPELEPRTQAQKPASRTQNWNPEPSASTRTRTRTRAKIQNQDPEMELRT